MNFESLAYAGVFLTTLLVFGVVVFRGLVRMDSPDRFFHFSGTRQNLLSLVVSNITVGTGLSYLLVAGMQNGLLMLLVPVAVVAGYLLLERFTTKVIPPALQRADNFFSGAQDLIQRARGERSALAWTVTLPLVMVFVLLFAYEIFVTSQVLAALIFPKIQLWNQAAVAMAVFLASLSYCWLGGVRAVFRTDQLQFIAVVLFLGLIVFAAVGNRPAAAESPDLEWLRTDRVAVLAVTLAVVSALATQFYSLINWFAVSNLREEQPRRRVLITTSVIIAVMFSLIVGIGATTSLDWSGGLVSAIKDLVAPLQSAGQISVAVIAVLLIGLTSIVLSTADTLMISLTMYVNDHVFRSPSKGSARGGEAVHRARQLLLGLFGLAFLLLAVMYYSKPDIFYLLLAIGGGAAVYAPFVVLVGFLARGEGEVAVLSNPRLAVYPVLFISATVSSITAASLFPSAVPYISLTHLLFSGLLSFGLWMARPRVIQPTERNVQANVRSARGSGAGSQGRV